MGRKTQSIAIVSSGIHIGAGSHNEIAKVLFAELNAARISMAARRNVCSY